MTEPTDAEIARAKRWAAMQTPPVTVQDNGDDGFEWTAGPLGLPIPYRRTADAAWSALAIALRPVFASVGPVLFEEAAKVCESTPVNLRELSFASERLEYAAAAIRAMK